MAKLGIKPYEAANMNPFQQLIILGAESTGTHKFDAYDDYLRWKNSYG